MMGKHIQREHGYLLNQIVLWIYLIGVWAIYIVLHFNEPLSYLIQEKGKFLFCLLLFLMGMFFLSYLIIDGIRKLPDYIDVKQLSGKQFAFLFIGFSMIGFLILLIWYHAYYPGAFSPDSISQYTQAVTGKYVDWHPVWHTLICYKLPLFLTGGWIGSIIFFQIIYFALALGYLGVTLYRIAGWKYTTVSFAYILLNPYTGSIAVYAWKDVLFCVTVLVTAVWTLRIYTTGGKWMNPVYRALLMGFFLANASLFRINGVLYTGVLALVLFMFVNRKEWLMMACSFALTFGFVKGPVYALVGTERPEADRFNYMGLPMSMIAGTAQEAPELLDPETAEFVYTLAPQEVWDEKYVTGNFNVIKYQIDMTKVDAWSNADILRLSMNCLKRAPRAALRSAFALTDMVYGLAGEIDWDVVPYTVSNNMGINFQGDPGYVGYLIEYRNIYDSTVLKYLRYLGFPLLAVLCVILGRNSLFCRQGWKRIALCCPILVHNFGTMLLLAGPDSRFFYSIFLICPVIILICFCRPCNI